MAKKNPDPDVTRETIREAAIALFMENGIHATSLHDIAQAANLSKGTLYYHFPSKNSLVLDIAEAHFAEISGNVYAWFDTLDTALPAAEAVRPLGAALLSSIPMRLHFALLGEAIRSDNELRSLMNMRQKEWAVMIELGALRMTDPHARRFREYSKQYIALLTGYAMYSLLDEDMQEEFITDLLTQ